MNWITRPQDETPAQGLQIRGKRLQATAKELLPVWTSPRVTFLPSRKKVDGNNFICFSASVPECSVVSDSQVAPEPEKNSFHIKAYREETLRLESRNPFKAPLS